MFGFIAYVHLIVIYIISLILYTFIIFHMFPSQKIIWGTCPPIRTTQRNKYIYIYWSQEKESVPNVSKVAFVELVLYCTYTYIYREREREGEREIYIYTICLYL